MTGMVVPEIGSRELCRGALRSVAWLGDFKVFGRTVKAELEPRRQPILGNDTKNGLASLPRTE